MTETGSTTAGQAGGGTRPAPMRLANAAGKIASRFNPQRVVLFGSYARGEATGNSDVDLLVLVEEPAPRGKRSAPIIQMLAEDHALPVDVVVRSPDVLQQWSGVPGSFSQQIASEGVVLYERQESG